MIYVLLVSLVLIFVFMKWSRKYSSPFHITMVFAPPGVGKTTYLVKKAFQMKKQGWMVYSTSRDIPCHYFINPDDIGFFTFEGDRNYLIIDEVSCIWHSRDFKNNFVKMQRNWLKFHRHQHLFILMASQSYDDVDKVIKLLTTDFWLLSRFANVFIVAKKIRKRIALTEPVGDVAGSISDSFEFEPWFARGSRDVTFLPNWVGKFDSYSKLPLPTMSEYYQDKNHVKEDGLFLASDDVEPETDKRSLIKKVALSLRAQIPLKPMSKYYDEVGHEIEEGEFLDDGFPYGDFSDE